MLLSKPQDIRIPSPTGFLVVEGVNGAGKSTLVRKIAAWLKERGQQTIETFEPGGTPLGQSLRKILLQSDAKPHDSLSELFLFAADRAEHVSQVIQPALKKQLCVISDRYYYSTLAFQGYGRGLDLKSIDQLMQRAIQGTEPDLVLLLDLDPKEGLKRNSGDKARSAQQGGDRFESEDLGFHERLRNGFLTIARESKQPFVVLDSAPGAEIVFEKVVPYLEAWIATLPKK